MFGGGGKIPKPAPLPPPPDETDKAVQEATAAAARRRKMARGFRSTILGSSMTSDNAPALKETLGS